MNHISQVLVLIIALVCISSPTRVFATPLNVTIPGSANPWLAGMPDGWQAAVGDDSAPHQSPVEVLGLPLVVGKLMRFSAAGQTAFGPTKPLVGPDGATEFHPHVGGAENGLADANVPTSSLLGVFLSSERPDNSPPPMLLDFANLGNVPGGIDYATLAPSLRQVFFIGDGLTSSSEAQTIVVPSGATRLFLGTKDGFDWYNNIGSIEVSVSYVPELSCFSYILVTFACCFLVRKK